MCFSTAGITGGPGGVFRTVWAGPALLCPAGGVPTCPTWAVSPACVAAASQGKAGLELQPARDPNLSFQHVRGGSQSCGGDPTSHPLLSAPANIQQRGERGHQLQCRHQLQESGQAAGPVNTWCLMELLLVKLVGNMSVRYVRQTCQSNLSTCWVFCVVLQPPVD